MEDCVEIQSSDEGEPERIGISSASCSPLPHAERSNTPVSANLRHSNQQQAQQQQTISQRITRRTENGQLKKLETDPKFLANFNPNTSRREKRKLNRKSTPLVVPKATGLYTERGIHRETGKDMCDCLDMSCPGCHFPCQCCGSAKCGPHCRATRKWMYESIEHDAKDLVIRNKLLIKK